MDRKRDTVKVGLVITLDNPQHPDNGMEGTVIAIDKEEGILTIRWADGVLGHITRHDLNI